MSEQETPKLGLEWAGTISHGTLVTDHLLQTFLGVLDEAWPARAKEIEAALEDIPGTFTDGVEAWRDLVLNEDVWLAMEEIAPEGFYFGAIEGDGADFGFWPNETDDEEE